MRHGALPLILALLCCCSVAAAQEGPPDPPRIRSIVLNGAEQISPGGVRKVMRLRQRSWWRPFQKNYFYGTDHLDRDLERIIGHYRAEGYFFVRIDDVLVEHLSPEWVRLVIELREGPRVYLRDWSVSGACGELLARLEDAVGLKIGHPLRERDLALASTRMEEICAEAGYALGEITRELRFQADSAAVFFRATPGPLVRVGSIEISGLERARESVVRREMALHPNDIFRRSRAHLSQDRLFDLGLFRAVRILPAYCDTCVTTVGPNEVAVDLTVVVREKEAGWYGGGFGFSSDDEVRVLGEWGYRNLFARARTLQLSALASWSLQEWERRRIEDPTEWEAEAVFSEPWLFGSPLRGQIRGGYRFNREPTFEEEIVSIEFRARRDLTRYRALLGSIQKKWVTSSDPTTEGRDYEIPSLSLALREDRRDFVLDPQRGYLTQVGGDYAGGVLGGPITFTRWALGAAAYVPLGRGARAAYRFRAGYLHPWGDAVSGVPSDSLLLEIPFDERFRAGGGTTVRGYATERLGVHSEDGQPLGGLALLLLNLELRFPLAGAFEGAIFLDAGNVWTHYRHMSWKRWTSGLTRATYSPLDVAYAAGLGLRFRTPVGPLRLDLGWKLNRARRAGSGGAELHFSLGQAF